MDGTSFLKTVRVGGFDKKDVLAYVDDLNTKIYTLEAELEAKKAIIATTSSKNHGNNNQNNSVDISRYDELLAANQSQIAELQTGNDALKRQINDLQNEMVEKGIEIEDLKNQNSVLEEKLGEAVSKITSSEIAEITAFDLSNIFIEAQKTASSIIVQARDAAKKLDTETKALANQIVDEANEQASLILQTADEKANKILSSAVDKSEEMRIATLNMKSIVTAEITDIEDNVSRLYDVLKLFSSESLSRLSETKTTLEKAQKALRNGNIPADNKKSTSQDDDDSELLLDEAVEIDDINNDEIIDESEADNENIDTDGNISSDI